MKLITRKEARAIGSQRYFTGQPCPRGHVAERYVSTMGCVACGVAIAESAKAKRAAARMKKPLSPRQRAKQAGELQYTPDQPCHRCETSKRLVSNGNCMQCAANAMRALYQENAEFRDKQAAYRKREAEAVKAHVRNRRAKMHDADGSRDADDVADLFDEQEGRCPYCNVFLRNWHVDHKTPLSRGGANDKSNLQLTCPTCNTRKHTKTDCEFRALLERERQPVRLPSPNASSSP